MFAVLEIQLRLMSFAQVLKITGFSADLGDKSETETFLAEVKNLQAV